MAKTFRLEQEELFCASRKGRGRDILLSEAEFYDAKIPIV